MYRILVHQLFSRGQFWYTIFLVKIFFQGAAAPGPPRSFPKDRTAYRCGSSFCILKKSSLPVHILAMGGLPKKSAAGWKKRLTKLETNWRKRLFLDGRGGVALTVKARCHLVTIMSSWVRIPPGQGVSYTLSVFHSERFPKGACSNDDQSFIINS